MIEKDREIMKLRRKMETVTHQHQQIVDGQKVSEEEQERRCEALEDSLRVGALRGRTKSTRG